MRILVTGGAGFIGSHLVEALLEKGEHVIVVDNESAISSDKFFWFEKAENYKIDILRKDLLEIIFKKGLDCVVHLAAETRIQPSIEDPEKCFNTNIIGTLNILELCRAYKVKKVSIASTSSIYGLNGIPNSEEQTHDCLNPYSASKFCSEVISNLYYKMYGIETVCFRFFNVFGERMPEKGSYAPVIAIFDKQKRNNQKISITGDGEQRRDFIHAKDVAEALILGITTKNKKAFGSVYNVGSGENYSINEIAKIIDNKNFVYIPPRMSEAKDTLASINKIKTELGWKPKIKILNWLTERKHD